VVDGRGHCEADRLVFAVDDDVDGLVSLISTELLAFLEHQPAFALPIRLSPSQNAAECIRMCQW